MEPLFVELLVEMSELKVVEPLISMCMGQRHYIMQGFQSV